ncbi:unnamed protein product [Amaranthus hypochondriacus]
MLGMPLVAWKQCLWLTEPEYWGFYFQVYGNGQTGLPFMIIKRLFAYCMVSPLLLLPLANTCNREDHRQPP